MQTNAELKREVRQIGQGPCTVFPREMTRLSPGALCLVMDLASECSEVRNGNMTARYSKLHGRHCGAFSSPTTLRRIIREAIDAGLIVKTSAPAGKPHTYALAWVELGMPRCKNHSIYPIENWKPRRRRVRLGPYEHRSSQRAA